MGAVEPLAEHDVARIRADNPGPLTLDGSNSWVLRRDPCWLVDPGPALPDHVDALCEEVERRGGLAGIAVTHHHSDHVEALATVQERLGPVAVAAAGADGSPPAGDLGPLVGVAVPGHAPDHLAFVAGPVCFTGDAVLGQGSVFVAPGRGAMAGYLEGLRRLRAMALEVLCPGHGPPVLGAPGKLDEYLEHRLERERRLVDALSRGLRDRDDLLDAAWSDAPAQLRPAAALTLDAHLHKLAEEGRLPADVEVGTTCGPLPEV